MIASGSMGSLEVTSIAFIASMTEKKTVKIEVMIWLTPASYLQTDVAQDWQDYQGLAKQELGEEHIGHRLEKVPPPVESVSFLVSPGNSVAYLRAWASNSSSSLVSSISSSCRP